LGTGAPIAKLDRASDYECKMGGLDLIFIYLSGLMISIGNFSLLKLASVEDK